MQQPDTAVCAACQKRVPIEVTLRGTCLEEHLGSYLSTAGARCPGSAVTASAELTRTVLRPRPAEISPANRTATGVPRGGQADPHSGQAAIVGAPGADRDRPGFLKRREILAGLVVSATLAAAVTFALSPGIHAKSQMWVNPAPSSKPSASQTAPTSSNASPDVSASPALISDAVADATFVTVLRQRGTFGSTTDAMLIELGHKTCSVLRQGTMPEVIVKALLEGGITASNAGAVVGVAPGAYCSDQEGRVRAFLQSP
jgi:hypothetical protein